MKFSCFFKGVEIIKTNLSLETEFESLSETARGADKKTPFICLRGERDDGHKYISEAVRRGAAVICEELPRGFEGKFVLCKNTRRADALIHSNLCGNPERELKLIGVTGTNGKTSVCHMIKAILEAGGKKCSMVGTVKNYIGGEVYPAEMTSPMPRDLYPMMAKAREMGDEYFIAEVSSHALEYEKFAPVTFALSVFTNLTPDHLDFHGTMENYARAKAKLFGKSIISLINEDDIYGRYMYENAAFLKYYYSALRVRSDFTCQDKVNNKSDGVEFDLLSDNEAIHIISHVPGEFTFSNTLAACGAARLLGVWCRDIALGIRTMKGTEGRMERVGAGADIEVFIDYAHTPDALEKLMRAVRGFSDRRRVVLIFGCGGDRDRTKRSKMGRIAEIFADSVIITSDNSRSEEPMDIINDILGGISSNKKIKVIENRREALCHGIMDAEEGDILVVAGKGHENYEIDKNGKHFFSEKDIIKEYLAKRQMAKGNYNK